MLGKKAQRREISRECAAVDFSDTTLNPPETWPSTSDAAIPLTGSHGSSEGSPSDCNGGGKENWVSESFVRAAAYGLVNGILIAPVAISFAAIIFRDPAFVPYLPRLVKLVLFSSAVHMGCFASLSSLKFAVGSVQDAGLIFLSVIASSVVSFAQEQGLDDSEMLSTACFVLCTCTAVLGVSLVLLGRCRLASIVQYLPMPVIGGYLGYIGYFCGQAGVALASGLEIGSIKDMPKLGDRDSLLLIAPALAAGVLMYLCLRRFPSPGTLPLLMTAFLGIFFAILEFTGTSLEDARAMGWVSEATPTLSLVQAWDYFQVRKVHFAAFVRVLPNLVAMIVVVAFSSCLDVAAIEMEMGKPLNFDAELQTVGWSNVISGLSGGFSGSYIFSQTIFSLRAGVDTRVGGYTSLVIVLAVAASPVSVLSYLPKCFFASLLVLIAVDLMAEWLWHSRNRMMPAEYMICLATFVAIQAAGVEEGMLAGLIIAALNFTMTYAQMPNVMTARVKSSTVMRTYEERVILQAYSQQMVVLELQGYIFFGSAVNILSDVKERIVWGSEDLPCDKDHDDDNKHTINRNDHRTMYNGQAPELSSLKQSQRLSAPSEPCGISPRLAGGRVRGAVPTSASNLWSRPSDVVRRASVGDIWSPVFSRSPSFPTRSRNSDATAVGRTFSREWGADFLGSDSVEEGSATPDLSSHEAAGSMAIAPRSVSNELCQARSLDSCANRWGSKREVDARASTGLDYYGALEEGTAEAAAVGAKNDGLGGGSGIRNSNGSSLRLPRCHTRSKSMTAAEGVGEGAGHTYMPLWTTSVGLETVTHRRGFSLDGVRSARQISTSPVEIPESEQRTRRVILDFSHVVGVDATAARSCFLMLKIVLQTSGTAVVFAGAKSEILHLLRAHGVINDEDPVFESLDLALEYSEEMLLQDRRRDLLLQGSGMEKRYRPKRGQVGPFPTSSHASGNGDNEVSNGVSSDTNDSISSGVNVATSKCPDSSGNEGAKMSSLFQGDLHGKVEKEEDEGRERPQVLYSAEAAEAAVFFGQHEQYYTRAGKLRMKDSTVSRTRRTVGDNPKTVGDVGSLQSILEDYLEVDRFQVPDSVRRMLGKAHRFFREERVSAGVVLCKEHTVSNKVYFIGSGSVELQIQRGYGRERLAKICAGGVFGELGFYLLTPQPFRVLARENCHLHTLDRDDMAKMQRENLELCMLVQKALMKSICLATSFSIGSAHIGAVDDMRLSLPASVSIAE